MMGCILRLLVGLLVCLLPSALWAGSLTTEDGLRVESLSRIAVEGLADQPPFLLLVVDGRDPFRVLDEGPLPLSEGVEISVSYRPASEEGALDLACRIVVTAVWLERDGEAYRQVANRPFDVLDSQAPECRDQADR
ncbi:MAG: hypothetical protein ACXIUL_13870 [Wenzhouxiangella sp.]